MSISSDWEIKQIREYVELLKQEYKLKDDLSYIHDELIRLSIYMDDEDINKANKIFEKEMRKDEIY